MNRSRICQLVAVGGLIAASIGGVTHVATAATPPSGAVNAATPVASWSGSGMAGAIAPTRRNTGCAALPTACDDYTLNIDPGTDPLAGVVVDVKPSSGAQMTVLLYAPGCASGPTDAGCYAIEGTSFSMYSPPKGAYLLRTVCTQCPATSSYAATATLKDLPSAISQPGNQSFAWSQQQLAASSSNGEPGISVNDKGTVIVNTFGPTVWISQDNGKTFGQPNANIDTTGCPSGDADAVVDSIGTLYADNLCLGGGTNLSYTSKDGGATWNADKSGLPSAAGTDSDRQWYALDPFHPGTLYFSYHDLQGPNINMLKSTDFGLTFTPLTPITVGAANQTDTAAGNTSARPIVDPSDPTGSTIFVFYTSNSAINSVTASPLSQDFDLRQMNLARSVDGGATWTNYLLKDFGTTGGFDNTVAHEFTSPAVDKAGNAYVAISERLGNETMTHIELVVVPKFAATAQPVVSSITQVDQGGLLANVFPSIAAGDAGNVDITWYGSPSADNNNPSSQWSQMFAQTTNGLATTPLFTQSRVTGGKPMHTADICLAGTLCLLTGGNRNLADFQTVAVDKCGAAQMVFTDDSAGGGTTQFSKQTAGRGVYNSPPAGCTVTGAPGAVVPESRYTAVLAPAGVAVIALVMTFRHRRRSRTAA
ncbi:MAG TPA: sialidase family protein [Candidatus Dormibacteraeota bacterium]|nr:sialidase family protein [Candidatus Dormibacteraeota bacterium]